MNLARQPCRATLLNSGEVLAAGGYGTATAELYNPATGTWSYTGSHNAIHAWQRQTLMADGRVLIDGGQNVNLVVTASAEIYDPSTGVWTRTEGMTTSRQYHSANLLADGRVFVAGGYDGNNQLLGSAEVYNSVSGEWRQLRGGLHYARDLHASTTLLDGSVLHRRRSG